MTSLSDTLTVGLVLVLLFGSIALYLYTRIQQAEQKISLLESILLDLKMSMEVKSYTNLPAEETTNEVTSTGHLEHYAPYSDDNTDNINEDDDLAPGSTIYASKPATPTPSISSNTEDNTNEIEQYKSVIAEAMNSEVVNDEASNTTQSLSTNYEAMTLKELQTIAKSRGITGAGSMKKNPIIEALKASDRSQANTIEPGSLTGSTGSFLETSGTFLGSESQ